MSLFKDSLNYLNTNKRKIVGYTITIISFLIISHGISFAEVKPSDSSSVGTMVVSTVNAIMRMAGAVLGALTFLVGLFLYPGWTSGSVIGLGDPLKTMWIMVSNIVYFIFAFIFIWIAFMNIIGKEDNYQLKQAIPRFIVGVLIVPFSWFFVQFIISLSSILTVGVLSLPYDTFKGTDFFSDSKLEVIELCSENIINIGSGSGANNLTCKNGAQKLSLKEMVSAKDSESLYGLIAFYTYGVMKIDTSGILYKTDIKSGVTNIFNLGLKMVLDIIFIIVYMLLMIALALALFVRGVMLWMFAMFSPVFGLLYFFKKGGDGAGKGASKHFNIKEFVKLALVPVYVAGALAFGLVFLFVAGTGFTKYSENEIKGGKSIISTDGSTVTLGKMSFTLEGARADSSTNDAKSAALGFKGSFGTMLLQLFGIGILWMAVMAALKSSDITESAVEPIADFGKSIGDLIKKSPGYMPIIPTPGGPISSTGLSRMGSEAQSYFQNKSAKTGTDFMQRNNLFQSENTQANTQAEMGYNKLKNLAESVKGNSIPKENIDEFVSAIKKFENVGRIMTSNDGKKYMVEMARRLDIKDAEEKVKSQKGIAELLTEIHNKSISNIGYDGGLFGHKNIQTDHRVEKVNEALGGSKKDSSTPSSSPTPSVHPAVSVNPPATGGLTTINVKNFSDPAKDTAAINVQLNADGKINGSADAFAKAFIDKGFKGQFSRNGLKDLLKNIGMKNDKEIDDIISKIL